MRLRLCCLAVAFVACASVAFADIPAPRPSPASTPKKTAPLPAARMSIEARPDATEARLQISQSVLRQLRAELDGDATTQAAASSNSSLRSTQTIIAGVFLSLSLAFAGVFIARTRSRHARQIAAIALIVCAAASVFAIRTLANIRPPEPRILNAGSLPRATTPEAALSGAIRVEIVPDGNEVKLILPAQAATETR